MLRYPSRKLNSLQRSEDQCTMNEFVILNYGLLGRETVIYTVYLIPALEFTLGQSKFIPMRTKMVGSNLWDEGAP